VHPDGEVAVARAAAARGTVMGLSSFASKPVEEVVEASPQTFFQTYWIGTRQDMAAHVERVSAAAVGDRVEVVLDGGIRRGGDVVKAVALGARAVLIGRAYLWGLAANGQAGVENVLDILRGGIDSALLGLGHSTIHDLTPDDLFIPPGFTRTLGASDQGTRAAGHHRLPVG
jgi:isopentenyl diphosphate isomerase/L-lactate dehydrogenase-like FMN-dependent dehydrogenase